MSFPKCLQGGLEFYISLDEELHENIDLLSGDFPVAIYAQDFCYAASDQIPFHWHEELQITWVSEGELEYHINGDDLTLSGDKLILINSHRPHSSRPTHSDSKTLCINFSAEIFQPVILEKYIRPLLDDPAFSYMLLPLKPFQITLLKKYFALVNEPADYFSVINFLSQIFETVLNDFDRNKAVFDYDETRLFQTILNFVHEHYAEPLTVRQIADSGYIGKNRLTALFSKYTNMSPIKYLNEYRLYAARDLIVHTDRSITAISEDVGYNQISNFIKKFRESYGMSPLKYRNKYS